MEFKGKIRNFHDIWKKDEDNVDITYNLSLLNMDMEKVFNETYRLFPKAEQEDKRKAYAMIILANEILKTT
tara:strand:+ start:649 stop:861 length:213 start_codon:yes stop_codon:yes gene_type:complete